MRIKLIAASLLCLFAVLANSQSQRFKGYPDRSKSVDVLSGFVNPPKGYGNVPFYWWNADSLNEERITEQLDILSQASTEGFAVSYIHMNPNVDTAEMKKGYGMFGRTEPGRPNVFSDEWWKIWGSVTEQCAVRGLGLGMDDYTVGWAGNGYYPDEILNKPDYKNYKGKLSVKKIEVKPRGSIDEIITSDLISAMAWPGKIDLSKFIKNNKLVWTAPMSENTIIYIASADKGAWLHPNHGKDLTEVYFDRYEKAAGKFADGGMNYFFQDELYYPIGYDTWAEDFSAEFKKRKGYDISPYLGALNNDIGEITPKIRLDFNDVLMDLAEDRYFKPIYEWHASRGLMYGADNLGRGLEPTAYGNYFRAMGWFTAPGNDAPSTGSSFIQTKVSSSISHMNERPRTWLEAFHSMGWGSSGSWLTQQMDHHFMAGGNLVCMHGLYYSTHGGWWEWAPPCFHFRMPYWPHVKKWLQYTERMSYLMSHGNHVCDIALMYPVEPLQAYPDMSTKNVFKLAMDMSNKGLDYDFIDSRSLEKTTLEKGKAAFAGESYKIIIIAEMKAMRHASLLKIRDHYRNGGIVLATGELPAATDKKGENDPEVESILKEIFGITRAQALSGVVAVKQKNKAGGTGLYIAADKLSETISTLITPDFIPGGGTGKVLHRRAGNRDIYMTMDVPVGKESFFRSTGKVEIWNPADGSVSECIVARQTAEGTWIENRHEGTNACLYVFSPGKPVISDRSRKVYKEISRTTVYGLWETELLPTMNNKWGDFRFPAETELIGAEARTFKHMSGNEINRMNTDFDDSTWPESMYGFGPQFTEYLMPKDEPFEASIKAVNEGRAEGKPYEISWQLGVFDNPGSQGYHGLKGKVSDGFFILNKGGHQIYKTWVYAPADGDYRIETDGVNPDYIAINGQIVTKIVNLKKGKHKLITGFANTENIDHQIVKWDYYDPRKRSAVVLYAANEPSPIKPSPYDNVISSKWGISNHLMCNPEPIDNSPWTFRFTSVPGAEQMEFAVASESLKVYCNGNEISTENIVLTKRNKSGFDIFNVKLPQISVEPASIAFTLNTKFGFQGAAAIGGPVKIKTGKGMLKTGDWSKTGALRHYSGGMYYRKQITLNAKPGSKTIIDLGDITASCELKVNGKDAGILMSPPYTADISKYVKQGTNNIEVLVYSTLSNHYQTIPTPYRDNGKAGLIGPVQIIIKE